MPLTRAQVISLEILWRTDMRTTAFPLIPPFVLHTEVHCESQCYDDGQEVKGKVYAESFTPCWSFRGREYERGQDRETLADGVEHAEVSGTLRLRRAVI